MKCMLRARAPALALAVALAFGLGGCKDQAGSRNHTAVLGGGGSGAADGPLTDAQGRAIPPPPVPAGTKPRLARVGDDAALAVWVQDGHVVASTYAPSTGWAAAQPLETIHGVASDPQLASNAQGHAMAVWRHTVGRIESLRFSLYQGTGWSVPDVVPGALPRTDAAAAGADPNAPRLQMDAQGNVLAQWPSGFDARQLQVARYQAGRGWTRAEDVPDPAAPPAAPAAPTASAASAAR